MLQGLSFVALSESEDWEQALKMLRALEPASLSVKSRSFYLYYKKILKEKLPDQPEVSLFYTKVDKTRRYSGGTEFTSFWSEENNDWRYPHPDFSDFLKTFSEGL